MTPDGLPMIGPLPGRRGVFVAAGHNMLGLTLAPTTGKAIADTVLGADPEIDLTPFAPTRPAMRA
jgi:D-amino-acid dehydrogenase